MSHLLPCHLLVHGHPEGGYVERSVFLRFHAPVPAVSEKLLPMQLVVCHPPLSSSLPPNEDVLPRFPSPSLIVPPFLFSSAHAIDLCISAVAQQLSSFSVLQDSQLLLLQGVSQNQQYAPRALHVGFQTICPRRHPYQPPCV